MIQYQDRKNALDRRLLGEALPYPCNASPLMAQGFGLRSIANKVSDTTEYINLLNDSRIAFEYAESLFADGDYQNAMRQYELVIEDDVNYENAKAGLSKAVSEYKNQALSEAQGFAEQGNFISAISRLNLALGVIEKDMELAQQRDIYQKQEILAKINEATSYADNGNYQRAVNSLRSLNTQYPDDNDVSRALTETETKHISDIVLRTNELVNENNYIDARIALAEGARLYPGNNDINNATINMQTNEKSYLIYRANNLVDEGKHDEAINLLRNSNYATANDVRSLIDEITSKRPLILGVDLLPYQSEGILLFSETEPGNMMGAQYFNGFMTTSTSNSASVSTAYFNLGGNYKYVSGLYSPIADSATGAENVTLTIWGDGRMLATYEMAVSDPVKMFSVDVTGVAQLKYEFTNVKRGNIYGVANLLLSANNEVLASPNEPIGLFNSEPVLGRDISAYRVTIGRQLSRAEPATIMGINYDNGYVTNRENIGSNRWVTGYAYYNINNQYTSLTGSYGPLDGTGSASGNIKIYGDERLLISLDLQTGDTLKAFSVDVTGITQMIIEITSATGRNSSYSGQFCVVDMKLSQGE
jgi:tetratricopeptide (TPR) repeat protein